MSDQTDAGATSPPAPPAPPEPPTKAELLDRARELEVPGRSSMSADELAAAIADSEAETRPTIDVVHLDGSTETVPDPLAPPAPEHGTPEEVGRPPLVEVAEARAARREESTRVIGAPNPTQEG